MADPSPSDNVEKEDTSAYFILDETGNSTLTPSGVKWVREGPVQSEELGTSGEVEGSKDDDDFETTGESLQSNTHTDTNTDTEMRSKKLPNRGTPQSARGRRRRLSKRKRQQSLTPVNAKRNKPALAKGQSPAMVTPGNLKKKRRNKKKTKSIIVIGDSDSEHEQVPPLPDISVVEIDDDDSVIVLSDDEVGVCSGSLSTAKRPLKPRNILTTQPPNVQSSLAKPFINSTKSSDAQPQPSQSTTKPVVEDFTGNYIKKTREEPQKDYFELYNPQNEPEKKSGLRPIIIDGSNVAFGHGRDRFSSAGLKICIDYFKKMGHQVTAFVPQFRKTHSATVDPQILDVLEKEGTVSFTPSRRTDGKMIIPYDDRYIVQYADAVGGIIVSRDNYRDLVNENPEYKDTIYKRLLMFTWVGDIIMFPKDPLGRGGPNLQEFLRF